jgi:uncharacterized protein (DUF111 family)
MGGSSKVTEVVYVELAGGLTGAALEEALAKVGAEGASLYASPVPAGAAGVDPALFVGLTVTTSPAPVDAEGLELLRRLSPSFSPPPPLKVSGAGEGRAGGAVVRALRGAPHYGTHPGEPLVVLEANVDDLSPQLVAPIFDAAFAAGALDAWAQPIIMKKGRPALVIAALCRPEAEEAVRRALFAESTTIGVRALSASRVALPRELIRVETEFGAVSVKVARLGGEVVNAHPEFEDCLALAKKRGVPVKRVMAAAQAAYWGGGRGG